MGVEDAQDGTRGEDSPGWVHGPRRMGRRREVLPESEIEGLSLSSVLQVQGLASRPARASPQTSPCGLFLANTFRSRCRIHFLLTGIFRMGCGVRVQMRCRNALLQSGRRCEGELVQNILHPQLLVARWL